MVWLYSAAAAKEGMILSESTIKPTCVFADLNQSGKVGVMRFTCLLERKGLITLNISGWELLDVFCDA